MIDPKDSPIESLAELIEKLDESYRKNYHNLQGLHTNQKFLEFLSIVR